MASGIETNGRLIKLYEQGDRAKEALQRVREESNLFDDDAATQEAMSQGLVTAIHRKVSRHRPAIISLMKTVEGIASHESNGIVLDFLDRIVRGKQKIDNRIAVAERKRRS